MKLNKNKLFIFHQQNIKNNIRSASAGRYIMDNTKKSQKLTNKKVELYIIYIIIFAIVLTPNLRIKALPSIRIEQLIILLLTINAIISLIKGTNIRIKKNKFVIMHSFFSVFIIFSILVGSIKGMKVIPNDFFELYKIYIYIGIFLITFSTVKTKEDRIKIIKFMMTCILISIIISIQQYFNLFNLNEKYVPLMAPTQYKTLVNNYPTPRVIGMTANPNEFAIMPGIGAILSWSMYLNTRKKKNLIFLYIYILGVLMTLSRSGFVFMVIGIAVNTFFYFVVNGININGFSEIKINLKNIRFIIFVIVLILLAAIIIFGYLPKDLTWRIVRGFDLKTDSSFQARLSNWEEHINYFKMSPVFGMGPAKFIKYKHHVDNEWLFSLRRYGIVGTLYFVISFVIPFTKGKDKFFKHIYFSVLLASSAYMLVVNIYNSFQVMPLIMVLAALIPQTNSKESK